MSRPKVSICIPTYNQKPEYLRECIHSALQQRYDSLEVVVSDNHSTNEATNVFFEIKDPRLKVIKPPRHLSMSGNFYFCIEQSHGQYINTLSSDDLLHPEFCQRLANILDQNPSVVFAHSAVQRIDEDGRVIGYERSVHPSFVRTGIEEINRYIWGIKNIFIAVLMRRNAYNKVCRMNNLLDQVADWELSLRLLRIGDVAYCSDVLASFRNWYTEERHQRILNHIRDVRLLYERMELDGTVDLIRGGYQTIRKARKKKAIGFASSLSEVLSIVDYEKAMNEIIMLNDSISVRIRLLLVREGLGQLLLALRNTKESLRQHIKSLLYPKSSGNFQ